MRDREYRLSFRSEAETAQFGNSVAGVLRPGDVVLLSGEIGAGKSFLARAIIRALCGFETEVPSPTFTLVQTYHCDIGEIWHSDLYRLGDCDEALELGLIEAFDTAINLVEWPDRLGPYRPDDALDIQMAATPEAHTARLRPVGAWAERLANAL
ncbi:MAG: tRNA (adenosine(37)-N6)-threonylcarbamoyltransferase complex ATPase subunit type 1 TsaE [Alphaproteobacteria bacterium]|jgi:tRNA threonylcarbamoyladenosine biosynthesis protein TsaE|nr:tRNA (adenosine(37)-N6)-threonylcarbamoyltransferase complex ATPase subunit type 1 TsaE [Alphaproteobacteria bacterium]